MENKSSSYFVNDFKILIDAPEKFPYIGIFIDILKS